MISASQLLETFILYIRELWLTLLVGFVLSGIFYNFLPNKLITKYFGQKSFRSIVASSIIGVILPVCCIGSLPIALTLKRKGASLGSVIAFLVATPATSITALIVCWKLLGIMFTVYIFFAVIIMAIVTGFICNGIKHESDESNNDSEGSCCNDSCDNANEQAEAAEVFPRIIGSLKYGLITLPKEMGFEIVIGILLASVITIYEPLQNLVQEYLVGLFGYLFVLIFGLVSYVCSTASVPLADALLKSGISSGQALCYLLVGPITSYGTILVIRKKFGLNVLTIYLTIICIFSLFCGIILDAFV